MKKKPLTPLPEDIVAQLDALGSADCPDCYRGLCAEPDDRMDTGFAWYCRNPDCASSDGCWPVMPGDIRRAIR